MPYFQSDFSRANLVASLEPSYLAAWGSTAHIVCLIFD